MKNKIIIIGVLVVVIGVATYMVGTRTDLLTGSGFGIRDISRFVQRAVSVQDNGECLDAQCSAGRICRWYVTGERNDSPQTRNFDLSRPQLCAYPMASDFPCTRDQHCNEGLECVNNRCSEPPVERTLRPNLVSTTDFLNAMNPDRVGTVVDRKFRWNNLNAVFPLRGVHYDDEVYALPFESNLRQAMGSDVCRTSDRNPDRLTTLQEFQNTNWGFLGEYNGGSASEFDAYCKWTNHRDAGRRTKTVNRFLKAHFDADDLRGASVKKVTVELRHASGAPKKDVGVHVFTVEHGVPLWKHNKYCVLKGTDQGMLCSFDIDGASIEQVVVARARWNARAGVPYVHDIYLTYIETPRRSTDNVLTLHQSADGEWQPGQTVGEMLEAQDGFLSADVTMPNGKVVTLTLGETKCLADGRGTTPFEEYAPGLSAQERVPVGNVLSQMLGREIGNDEFTHMLNTGRFPNSNRKIGVCDNTKRCERSRELTAGIPRGAAGDGRIRAEDYARGLLGGDPRMMEGDNKPAGGDEPQGSTTTGSFPDGTIVSITENNDPNTPDYVVISPPPSPDIPPGTTLTSPIDPQNNTFDPTGDGTRFSVDDVIKALTDVTISFHAPVDMERINADLEKRSGSPNGKVMQCPPDSDECYELSEQAQKSLDFMNDYLRARGLTPASDRERELTPEELRRRQIERVGRPADAPDGGAGGEPVPDVEQCLLRRRDIAEVAMPGPEGAEQACVRNCPPQDMSVGHTCDQLQEARGGTSSPSATCETNMLGQRQQAIRCPEDNPNCAEGVGDIPEEGIGVGCDGGDNIGGGGSGEGRRGGGGGEGGGGGCIDVNPGAR